MKIRRFDIALLSLGASTVAITAALVQWSASSTAVSASTAHLGASGVAATASHATGPTAQTRVTDPEAAATAATVRIVRAAQAVVATLSEAQRAKLLFAYDSGQSTQWSNFPSGIFQRNGVRLGDLSSSQRAAVMNLLAAALSVDGYRKVTEIMHGDEVLRMTEAAGGGSRGNGPGGGNRAAPDDGQPPNERGDQAGAGRRGGGGPVPGGPGRGFGAPGGLTFGEAEYYLAFVGTPSTSSPWMLQYGGHHLAINLTIGGSQASMTPSLPAVQPATYSVEGRTVRPLGDENDKALALINALNAAQRDQAVLDYRVSDLVLGPGQDGRRIQPEGLRATSMSAAQQTALIDLVREWAGIVNDAYAAPRMREIEAGLGETFFAWSGPTSGTAAYFRIQGPSLVIEYAPQGGADHIHTIYRDPTNDYGSKFSSH